MNDSERIAIALERIAAALDGILESTSPLNPLTSLSQLPDEDEKVRAFYTSEDDEIIAYKLRQMGKEPKP